MHGSVPGNDHFHGNWFNVNVEGLQCIMILDSHFILRISVATLNMRVAINTKQSCSKY